MAERRMFAKTIIDSDAFLDMPQSSQNLYFHLSMRADDDGFINNPKKIMRIIGSSQDDMNVLIAKKFLIIFEAGVVVIKHWLIHNYIRKDRYRETSYTNEKKLLTVNDNGSYSLKNQALVDRSTNGLPAVDAGKDRIGKDRIGKDRLDTMSGEPDHIPYSEIIGYLNDVLGTKYKHSTKKTRDLIKARWNEDFVLDDFKRVIDIKHKEWKDDKKMSKFLRPETLFGTKFESYLNQEEPTTQQTDTMRKLKELHDRYEREGK